MTMGGLVPGSTMGMVMQGMRPLPWAGSPACSPTGSTAWRCRSSRVRFCLGPS